MNIKLEMKNETDRQIIRHTRTTQMCFNLIDPRNKNFDFFPTLIKHFVKAPAAKTEAKALSMRVILSPYQLRFDL